MPVEELARPVPAIRRSSSAGMVIPADIVTVVLQHTKTRCMTSVDTCSTADALAGVRMTSALTGPGTIQRSPVLYALHGLSQTISDDHDSRMRD